MCVEADTGSWSSGTLSSNMESKTGSWVISTMSLSSSTTLPNCSTSGLWLCRQQKDQGSSIKWHQIDIELLDHIYFIQNITTLNSAHSIIMWGNVFARVLKNNFPQTPLLLLGIQMNIHGITLSKYYGLEHGPKPAPILKKIVNLRLWLCLTWFS